MIPKRLTFAIPLIFALPACLPAQVTVLTSGGFSAAYQELLPQFENSTGITVTTVPGASQGDGPTTIAAELRRGQPADVVILSREGLAELSAEGRIVPGSDVDLASVPLGLGVRTGTPHPDIGTVWQPVASSCRHLRWRRMKTTASLIATGVDLNVFGWK